MRKKKAEEEQEIMALPIEWHVPEGRLTPFATNMVVQMIDNEFKLLFFEIKPPLRLDEKDPLPTKAVADYVTGVIITADRLQKFIDVLQGQLTKYLSKKQRPSQKR